MSHAPMPDCQCPPMHLCPRHGLDKPKREPSPRSEGRTKRRSKGLAQESFAQKLRKARWEGIKDATIYYMNKLDPDGACCNECGRKGSKDTLDLDHVVPTGKGGKWWTFNSQLLCRECHQKKHRNLPEWTETA